MRLVLCRAQHDDEASLLVDLLGDRPPDPQRLPRHPAAEVLQRRLHPHDELVRRCFLSFISRVSAPTPSRHRWLRGAQDKTCTYCGSSSGVRQGFSANAHLGQAVRFEPTDGGCAGPAGRFGIAATANNALSVFLGPVMGKPSPTRTGASTSSPSGSRGLHGEETVT